MRGETITVYSGNGVDSETDLFWGRTRAVGNNRGDNVYLVDGRGVVHIEY
ncbi:MAG: hypothetical protein P8Y28_10725 [Gammaproteobacteria bacterium]